MRELERKKDVVNKMTEIKSKSISQIVMTNVFTLFNLVNIILAICLAMVHSYRNMLFLGVVFWNALIGIIQEIRAKRIVDKLSLLSKSRAHVIRPLQDTEKIIEIPMEEIRLGDIMLCEDGNQISADAKVLEGECQVNESLLTGESDAVDKKPGDELLSGSFILSGKVKAEVIRVGRDSYANKITVNAKYIKKPNSQIMKAVRWIIKMASLVLFPMGITMFCKQYYFLGQPLKHSVEATVASIIGMMPSGLVLLTSVVLAVATIRLAKENTLVQELFCIETLARVDVLCLDKTGTITEGRMKVDEVLSMPQVPWSEKEIAAFVTASNDHNPTYRAIRKHFNANEEWQVKSSKPFSSTDKYSIVDFETKGCYILGAPEMVLQTRAEWDFYNKNLKAYLEEGKRVLVFAKGRRKPEESLKALPEQRGALVFLVLSDVIRENARETLQFFAKNQVDIKVISGDNPVTVANIAKRAGVQNAKSYVDARTLKTRQEIEKACQVYTVFGRVSPDQKLEIIKALKKQGHTVAMTGDGVNDVMALKEADCSIAMQSGSDAARSVSNLVLLDSDFSSMPKIVAEGRRSINNLTRSATLFLIKTIYTLLLSVTFLFLPVSYPFAPIQLTLIGTLSIGIPSFVLALEPNHSLVKGKFIKNVLLHAVPGGILVYVNIIASVILLHVFQIDTKIIPTVVTYTTMIAAMIILFHLCHPFNLLRGSLYIGIGAVFMIATTFFRNVFGIVDLDLPIILIITALSAIGFLLHWGMEKSLQGQKNNV